MGVSLSVLKNGVNFQIRDHICLVCPIESFEWSAVEMETSQILELQEELHQADSRAETLQAQINEIYKNVDDEPDSVDGSGTRAGSPACPKDGRGSSGSTHAQRPTTGLRAVAKIHKMRLSKQYLVSGYSFQFHFMCLTTFGERWIWVGQHSFSFVVKCIPMLCICCPQVRRERT